MREILIGTILALAGVFFALALAIAANKLWRDGRDRFVLRRRQALEPGVLAYLTGSVPSLREGIGRRVRLLDRLPIEILLLELEPSLRGEQRQRLATAFEELGLVRRYVGRLGARSWWRRALAAERLGASSSSRAIGPLTQALTDEEPEVRLRAARALADLGGPTAVRPLVMALNEPSRWSAIRIASILASRGEMIVGDLIGAYDDLSPAARLSVIDIVGEIAARSATGWLRSRLEDPDTDVRARAANALGRLGDEAAGAALDRALHDRAWQVRAMAAQAAGRLNYRAAIPHLAAGLRDDAWWVRTNSAEALLAMGQEGLDTLLGMLDDVDRYAAHQAVSVLQDVGALDGRVDDLAAVNPDRREAAREFVIRLTSVGQVERLRELMENHPLETVRRQLADLIPAESAVKEGVA